jgi:hypothetical protein
MAGVFQPTVFQPVVFQMDAEVDAEVVATTPLVSAGADINLRFAEAPCHAQVVLVSVVTN